MVRAEPTVNLEYDSDTVKQKYDESVTYYEAREYKKALECLNKAIAIDPNYADAYRKRAMVYFRLKKYNKAIADYYKRFEITNDYEQLELVALMYIAKKDYRSAIKIYSKIIKLSPERLAFFYFRRGNYYAKLGKYFRSEQDYKCAVEEYSKLIEEHTTSDYFYSQRGKCYRALGEIEKARADFAKAEELSLIK